ncbi:hypothetical protein PENSUB_1507 [Penicillium subrubescens]|uniref:Uncharacterized protein n=1 Tax=Penicillium subrubescens TaxID=1316194 RepID=A0A1Q5UJV8_9EURO|nr:hypothetical protein PENSUB_1507 [Penicillium subrubescens]
MNTGWKAVDISPRTISSGFQVVKSLGKILPEQKEFYNDATTKNEARYAPKGKFATKLARFIPFEALPPMPNTSDMQEC